ncbi:solute carrier family 28 member 3-like [Ctenocephalides felis]|uniref:solute carrier family 28 member 3-like n=1 Tax=Ctenocephalides felis TaxID=7515 RepID=UPI000E6E4CD0|nr:solute carrier family 28 member 3-like [Ctenocephalides felis]
MAKAIKHIDAWKSLRDFNVVIVGILLFQESLNDGNEDDTRAVEENGVSKAVGKLWDIMDYSVLRHKKTIKVLASICLHVLAIVYFAYATSYWYKHDKGRCNYQWCDGYGFLAIIYLLFYLGFLYFMVFKRFVWPALKKLLTPTIEAYNSFTSGRWVYATIISLILSAIIIFIIADSWKTPERLQSFSGIFIILFLGFFFSKYPGKINWKPVFGGIICQIVLGMITIRWEVGRDIFSCLGEKVSKFLKYTDSGSAFVYSDLLVFDNPIFGFQVLSIIYFFSFTINILFYLETLQWVLLKLGWILQTIVGTTVCESVVAAANMFIGMTEAPLVIKPYIDILTNSELHSIITSGFATVSGTVLAAYISFGAEPAHLLTSSVMAAPASLAFSKLFYPETEKSKTTASNIQMAKSTDASLLDAACNGAMQATSIILGVIANIIAFVAFVAFLNGTVGYLGTLVGNADLTFEQIFGYIFMPLSWVMGIPWSECEYVGTLIGLKTVINEFAAYQKLGAYKKAGLLSPRSAAIATYSVCGFANPASIGIVIAVLGALSPKQKQNITAVSFRAFISGNAVCFLTASIAGLLMGDDDLPQMNTRHSFGILNT